MQFSSEADARINIDQLLRDAGWDPADKQQVRTEVPTSSTSIISDDEKPYLGNTGAPKKIDYVLHSSDGLTLLRGNKHFLEELAIETYDKRQKNSCTKPPTNYTRFYIAP